MKRSIALVTLALVISVLETTSACGNLSPTGDITAVTTPTGSGLSGGTLSGAATLTLLTTCTTNQILKWSGSAWACAADAAGTGTVTSIVTSSGITGGPITGTGTIGYDSTVIQSRVSGTCGTGNAIRVIDSAGAVTCQAIGAGTITGVTAGTSLTGGGTSGAVTLNVALPGASCSAGSHISALSAGGTGTCTADASGGITNSAPNGTIMSPMARTPSRRS